MNGKDKCRILKEIRREIAAQNDIALTIADCRFQGACRGTCPKCEAEVAYLEKELEKRRLSGKAVAVAGIAAAVMLSAGGCTPDAPPAPTEPTSAPTEYEELIGDVPYIPSTDEGEVLDGYAPEEDEFLLGEEPLDETAGYGDYDF